MLSNLHFQALEQMLLKYMSWIRGWPYALGAGDDPALS